MTTILVSDQKQLAAALNAAKAGDVIQLTAGNYGDVVIKSKVFAADVTIMSKDLGNPAILNSLNVLNSSGINFVNLDVSRTPDASTVTFSWAVQIDGSKDIMFSGGHVQVGAAVSGVTADALATEAGGNVIGMWTGRGITIHGSSDVTVEGVEISKVFRGITMSNGQNITIRNNEIHDTRTSSIVAANVDNLVITGNHLHDANPWRWGNGGKGDHGDYIHIWTDPKQGGVPTKNITIANNRIEQGDGTALLGIYLDDNSNKTGFTNVNISKNVILNGNGQGIRLENVFNSKVIENVLLQTSGTEKDAPGIIVASGSHTLEVAGNVTDLVSVSSNSSASVHGNTLVQREDPSAAGYYSSSLLAKATALHDPAAIRLALDADLIASKASAAAWLANPTFKLAATVDTDVGFKAQAKSGISQQVVGGRGDDQVVGLGGNDTLVAGAGNDRLAGNGGNDVMSGGAGADTFIFEKAYATTGGSDTIIDFSRLEGDKINVHSMDANTLTAAGDAFTFIGTQVFHKVAGELRYDVIDGKAVIQGDLNGDGVGDFTIQVMNVTSLNASDFIL